MKFYISLTKGFHSEILNLPPLLINTISLPILIFFLCYCWQRLSCFRNERCYYMDYSNELNNFVAHLSQHWEREMDGIKVSPDQTHES